MNAPILAERLARAEPPRAQRLPMRRDIPFNYTSLADRDIAIRLLGADAGDVLDSLAVSPIDVHSRRLLLALLGELWVVRRNPYLQDDLLDNPKRRQMLIDVLSHRLAEIDKRRQADLSEHGDEAARERASRVAMLTVAARGAVESFA
ncbi:DUF3683 domain-containing protein, partial [Burkholderia sp. Ac-20379]|uniref:DUF3683 domain-containing protein n=1 Tax=Burkholderia sp. Ac-20379 TaxID=2703900 RepID=UPI00197E51A8